MQRKEEAGRKPAGADPVGQDDDSVGQDDDRRCSLQVLNADSAAETAVLNSGPLASWPTACGPTV